MSGTLPRPLATRIRETLSIAGVMLMLLSLLLGVAVQLFPHARLATGAHITGLMSGTMLLAFGLTWRKLNLSTLSQHLTCWFAVAGHWLLFVVLTASAVYGARMLTPMAHAEGRPQGDAAVPVATVAQEWQVAFGLGLASLLIIVSTLWLLVGLVRHRERSIRSNLSNQLR